MKELSGNFAIAVHPGDILQEMLDEREVSQAQLARHLHTDLARINEICRRRRGISARMALMLGQALGTTPTLWMNLQKNWELSQVDPRSIGRIKPLKISA
jgi:addiction module HigA family antidote